MLRVALVTPLAIVSEYGMMVMETWIVGFMMLDDIHKACGMHWYLQQYNVHLDLWFVVYKPKLQLIP